MKLSDEKYKELISRLGKESDSELAREFGISRERVRQLRSKRGINHLSITNPTWRIATIDDDTKIAEFKKALATKPASTVSILYNISDATVRMYRKKFNIPNPSVRKKYQTQWEKKLTPEQQKIFVSLLGKVSDCELSRRFGLKVANIGHIRKKFGIDVYPDRFLNRKHK